MWKHYSLIKYFVLLPDSLLTPDVSSITPVNTEESMASLCTSVTPENTEWWYKTHNALMSARGFLPHVVWLIFGALVIITYFVLYIPVQEVPDGRVVKTMESQGTWNVLFMIWRPWVWIPRWVELGVPGTSVCAVLEIKIKILSRKVVSRDKY